MLTPKSELFKISILSAEGFEVMARKESGVTIFQGVNIDLANLIAGTYILKIESPHFYRCSEICKVEIDFNFIFSNVLKNEKRFI